MFLSAGRLSRDTLEPRLRTMTVDQGRAAYLAFGSVDDAVTTLERLAAACGVAPDAIAAATQRIREGAREVRRLPMPRALSRG